MARAGLVKRTVRVRTKHGIVNQQRMVRADASKTNGVGMSARMQRANMIAGTVGGAYHGHDIGAMLGQGLASLVPKRQAGTNYLGMPKMRNRVGVQNALVLSGTALGAIGGAMLGRKLTRRAVNEGRHGGLMLAGTAAASAALNKGGAAGGIYRYYAPSVGAHLRSAAFVTRENIKRHGVLGGVRATVGAAGSAARHAAANYSERLGKYQAIHSVQGMKGVRKMAARDLRSVGRKITGAFGGAYNATVGRGVRAVASAAGRVGQAVSAARKNRKQRGVPPAGRAMLQLGSGR